MRKESISDKLTDENSLKDMLDNREEKTAGSPDIKKFGIRIEELENRINRLDSFTQSIKKEMGSINGTIEKLSEQILKLAAIYEKVSMSFNPFVDIPEGNPPERVRYSDNESSEEPEEAEKKDDTAYEVEDVSEVFTVNEKEESAPELRGGEHKIAPPDEVVHPENPEYTVDGDKILSDIDMSFSSIIGVFKWLEFLLAKMPRDSIPSLLDYYEEIGWIGEEAKKKLQLYLHGELPPMSRGVGVDEPNRGDWRLPVEDHLRSLLFISLIAGKNPDIKFIDGIEEQVRTILKEEVEAWGSV